MSEQDTSTEKTTEEARSLSEIWGGVEEPENSIKHEEEIEEEEAEEGEENEADGGQAIDNGDKNKGVEEEIASLEKEEFKISDKKTKKTKEKEDLAGFKEEDFLNKKKFPELREALRNAVKGEKEALGKLSALEERIEKLSSLEEDYSKAGEELSVLREKVKAKSFKSGDFNEFPEYADKAAKIKNTIRDFYSSYGDENSPFASSLYSLTDRFNKNIGDVKKRDEVAYEAALMMIGSNVDINEYKSDEGAIDWRELTESLSSIEQAKFALAEEKFSSFAKEIDSSHKELVQIQNKIESEYENISSQASKEKYNKSAEEISSTLKSSGILSDSDLAGQEGSFAGFISKQATDSDNEPLRKQAMETVSEYRLGRKPISEAAYKHFEDLGQSREDTDKRADSSHAKRVASMDKKIFHYLANESEIHRLVELGMKADAENRKSEKAEGTLAEIEKIKGEAPTIEEKHISSAEIFGFSPR